MNDVKPLVVILARGGSKEIENKNLEKINGKSLLEITVNQITENLDVPIFVSSDSKQIIDVATSIECSIIKRPEELCDDNSTSEEGISHAINFIEDNHNLEFDTIVFPQLTSPLRKYTDFPFSLEHYTSNNFDSLFSSNEGNDINLWKKNKDNQLIEVNFENDNRQFRQSRDTQLIENGSFYIFDKELYKKYKVRLFRNIGYFNLEPWQMFEIDTIEDLNLCREISKIKNVDGIYEQ